MQDKKKTIYLNGIKTIKTGNYDSINFGINVEQFYQEMKQHANDRGFINVSLQKRREVDKYGGDRSAVLLEYSNNDGGNKSQPYPSNSDNKYAKDLPF